MRLVPLIIACLLATAVSARTLTLTVQWLHDPQLQARALRLAIDEQGDRATLRLSAAHVEAAALGLAGQLDWHCALQRASGTATACSGPVRLVTTDGRTQAAELAVRIDAGRLELALERGGSSVLAAIPFTQAPTHASLQRVPATWLKGAVAGYWPGGEIRDGVFDVDATLYPDGHAEVDYALHDLAFNTRDGTVSGNRLDLSGRLRTMPRTQAPGVELDAVLAGGTLAAGALQVTLPDSPVEAGIVASAADDGRWDIARFRWRDAGTLELEADGAFDPAALAPLRELRVRVGLLRLPQASARYARAILAAQGLDVSSLRGDLGGTLEIDARGLQRLTLTTAALDIHHAASDVTVSGLHGGIDWAARGERPATTLAWKAGSVADVALSAASARWQSRDGALHLLGTLRTGLLGGRLELVRTVVRPPDGSGNERLDSGFSIEGVGHDSADGSSAAANVAADGELHFSMANGMPRLRVNARLHGGEVLAGPAYVKLPSTPVALALDARMLDAGWRVDAFDWDDAGVLAFGASGEIVPDDARPLRSLRFDLREAQLGPALERYAQSWLATKGYGDLSASGSMSGRLELAAQGLRGFGFAARGVQVRDGAGRFAVSGLDGAVDWDIEAIRPATHVGWDSLELFRIPLGPARAALESRDGAIRLLQPFAVDVLGGQWRLEKLGLQPRSPRGERYTASFAIVGIDMAQLSDAFGWPRFGGNLSGGIPEIELAGDTVQLHGGLDLYVFDGHLGVNGLTLERPFGVAPSLGANIHFQNLDLEQVTRAFSFGGMSGRLDGTIGDLRLVNWSPVAFDAWLRTRGGGRMSYNAVNDLTSIGGGGLSANLQTMALKLFDTFGYRRLGIRCRLRDEVCTMGGIDPVPDPAATGPAGAGYTIVEGSGVPRITIVGHHRRVDWPTLLSRLQEATQGQAPVVE